MKEIIYSPGYGAGWASWNNYPDELGKFVAEYKPLIEWLKGATIEEKYTLASKSFKEAVVDYPVFMKLKEELESAGFDDTYLYLGGLDTAEVMTIPDRVGYRIIEYDGYESVMLQSEMGWW